MSDSFSIQALYKNEKAAMHVQSLLEQEGRSAGLKGFEIVKMVHLSPHAFAVENGLQTPSFKLKRPALKKKFEEEIKHMYSVLGS
jgi:long-chain acyl-CoA synthetase